MPHTLVVGLGRSGAGLHVPVLDRLRRTNPTHFADHPIVGFDPHVGLVPRDVVAVAVDSLERAGALLPPDDTVVHVCTPPGVRASVLARLAGLGFRRLVVEKPLATDPGTLAEIERLRTRHRLDIVVLTHWVAADLTRRLSELVRSGGYGPLTSIVVRQDKPRFGRSARNPAHRDAFDIEIPHALAVALALAGPAELTGAGWTDRDGEPLRGAWLSLRHTGGTRTLVRSDLTCPVRRREITLRVGETTVVGHYPVSADDHHAQLCVGAEPRQVFEDDALAAFLLATYRYFTGAAAAPPGEFGLHARVVQLLAEARARAGCEEEVPAHAG